MKTFWTVIFIEILTEEGARHSFSRFLKVLHALAVFGILQMDSFDNNHQLVC